MDHQNHKIIYFNAQRNDGALLQSGEKQHQYQCMLSGNRLDGQCELLIYNCYQRTAELFALCFSPEGQTVLQYFQEEEVLLWKHSRAVRHISYHQAMTLLGDAVRRLYREQGAQNAWNAAHTSVHIQHIWQHAYYNSAQSSLDWLLTERDYIPFIKQYFRAVNNKDAVLLYDMMAENKRRGIVRELYAYSWSHELEELQIRDWGVIHSEKLPDAEIWAYYVTICGEYPHGESLSVDICFHLVMENGYVRLQEFHVLEASHITSCCREL